MSQTQPLSPLELRARDSINALLGLARQAVSLPANLRDITSNSEAVQEAESVLCALLYQDVAAAPQGSNGLGQVRATLHVEQKNHPCHYWTTTGKHIVVNGVCRCGETFALYRARTTPEGAKITAFENVKVFIPALSDAEAYDTLCGALESIPGCEYMTDSYSSQETLGEDRDTSELFRVEQ